MNRSDCVELGYFAKAHGMGGELRANLDVYDITEYSDVKMLYVGKVDEVLRPIRILSFLPQTDKYALVTVDGVSDRPGAEAYVSMGIYYPKDLLPKLPDPHFYFHEVIGFQVEDENEGLIGELKEILDLPNNELLQVDHQGKEVLIPMKDGIFLGVDKLAQKIRVHLPPGLLELYIGE
jgi:16S rRNA processing protein RimM